MLAVRTAPTCVRTQPRESARVRRSVRRGRRKIRPASDQSAASRSVAARVCRQRRRGPCRRGDRRCRRRRCRSIENNVEVKTPDGTCDAAFIHPSTGSHPGVLIWPDAFGLRPSMRDIGKRIAAEGYSVLVPNPFYRVAKAPVFEDASTFSFQNPTDMREAAAADGLDQRARAPRRRMPRRTSRSSTRSRR